MESQKLTNILFTCGREPAYPRNDFLLSVLKQHYRVESITSSSRSSYIRYAVIAARFLRLLWKKPDLIVAGFLGQPLMPILRSFTRQPILLDPFVSIYDTLVSDRRSVLPESPVAKAAFWLDQWSLSHANIVLADTKAHALFFQDVFGIAADKIKVLLVGADEKIFYPRESTPASRTVLYYSSYLPLHGSETVVRAAKVVQDRLPQVCFHLIGRGIEYERIRKIATETNLNNIKFSSTIPIGQLPEHIAGSAICLGGHFGKSEKARRVIAGKTYQCIAMGKATIVGDNPANRELLNHGQDAWFCDMDNPQALADAICTLIGNSTLRNRLGENARQTFLAKASYATLGEQLSRIVQEMIER